VSDANEFVSLEEARAFFPGCPPKHRLYYWAKFGLASGAIRLEYRQTGQNMVTTRAWCEDFQKRWDAHGLKGRRVGKNGKNGQPETPAKAEKRRTKTAKKLDKIGCK